MILEFMENNLYEYLNRNHNYLIWERKLQILFFIIKGLYNIHERGLVHKDFHTGNILIKYWDTSSSQKKKEIWVKEYHNAYISRSIKRRGKPYTQAADIYSLGMIIYTLATGHQPFDDVPHDFHLSLEMCWSWSGPVFVRD